MGGSESVEFMVRDRRRRGLDRVLRRVRLRRERREGDLGAGAPSRTSRGPPRPRSSRRPACARSRSSPRSRAARRPSARSRRSSTCSTARSRSCCCAATTSSHEQKLADAHGRAARSGRRAPTRSAPRSARAPGSLGAVGVARPPRPRRRGAARPPRHDDRREPGRLPPARRRRRRATSPSRAWHDLRTVTAGEALPALRARRSTVQQDHRGRPHLQARHALQRGARRARCSTSDGKARAARDGLLRHRHRAHAWRRWSSATTTRTASSGR